MKNNVLATFWGAFVVAVGVCLSGAAMGQSIYCTSPLNFGALVACPGGGTVTITADGARRTGGCITALPGAYSRGLCRVDGLSGETAARAVQVSMDSVIFLNGPNGTMQIDQITFGNGETTPSIALLPGDNPIIPIGGRLNFEPYQSSGSYTGTYIVNLDHE